MKSLLIAISMAVATVALSPLDADARRLGGGRNAGLQRQAPAPAKPADAAKPAENPAAPAAAPATNAAPVAAAAAPAAAGAAAANAGRRSWWGPVTGLAAGLGLAALASHLGFGETLANVMTLLLLAFVATIAIRWLMRRFAAGGGMQFAGAARLDHRSPAPLQPTLGGAPSPRAPDAQPAGFDAEDFERLAKMVFIRMQAANDAGDVEDLRKFTTPELFASLRLDLHERAGAAQRTDVLQLHARVLDTARDEGRWVVSVRFHGLLREQADAGAQPFDEVWHLVKPADGSHEWAIAGITQAA